MIKIILATTWLGKDVKKRLVVISLAKEVGDEKVESDHVVQEEM